MERVEDQLLELQLEVARLSNIVDGGTALVTVEETDAVGIVTSSRTVRCALRDVDAVLRVARSNKTDAAEVTRLKDMDRWEKDWPRVMQAYRKASSEHLDCAAKISSDPHGACAAALRAAIEEWVR